MIKDISEWLRRHRWLALILQLVILLIVFTGFRAWQLRDAISGVAPNLHGQLVDMQDFNLRQYAGKPALIYFWASWCPMCKMTNSNVNAIAKDYQVISLASWSGDAMEVKEFMQQAALDMPVIADNEGYWAEHYGVRGVPASFIIDAAGEIQFIESGYTSEYGLRIRLWWLTDKG